ncbi:radical SAM family heme chaperone HemW [Actinomycetospora corticicola]|uniref:Heme chaperone HemW n=1 Tax=Actinomycetospora corticicola TaxID=663602 RepID=A0A7Y9DRM4_9PSEU|nr:radical SAM family heme chaperone HemW [Actinomycetospora corticicola]NYD34109.1 oxygen-independent coproporphyrinogen-3 oxidase [Actinomycetospora corticicola]
MPSVPPGGEPAPADGSLPPDALTGLGTRPFGVYVHVPFCATRCGYCDFNTYTASDLGLTSTDDPASPASWLEGLRRELDLAGRVLGTPPPADTVFIGGGTPSLLGADGLTAVLDAIRSTVGLAPGAEVTTEANPESTTPELLAAIADAGYTRLSLGMQSDVDHVLAVLDRRHTPGAAVSVARAALEAGLRHVNLDLIYGTPTETDDDLRRSLDAVLASGADHVSAYSLIVEDGTALARRVARGELPMPDDDVLADRYEIVDDVLTAHGLGWYEVSNWARTVDARCRHNLGYWSGGDWWGAGPGAHSHVGGVRWWNVRHPARYSKQLAAGESPAEARELLTPADRHVEQVLLQLRTVEGLPARVLHDAGRAAAVQAVRDGLLDDGCWARGQAVLTRPGRLLADGVAISLTGD